MSIHVCLISSARLFEAQIGGEGRFTHSLGRWLSNHRYPVTLIGSTFFGTKAKHMSPEIVKLRSQKHESKSQAKKRNPRAIYPPYFVYSASRYLLALSALVKVARIHRVNKIEIIHAQDTGYSGLAAIFAGKLLRLPVVISSLGLRHIIIASQNSGTFNRLLAKMEYKLDLFCVRMSDGLIAANPFIMEYYEAHVKGSLARFQFIPIPINASKFSFDVHHRLEIRSELGIPSNYTLIGFIGRFAVVKNLIMLLEAFEEVLDKLPSCMLLLVGAGIQEKELRNLVKVKGLDQKVIFTGIRADVSKVLCALDIFALPSITEGLSTALLEAMACGRAVICSDIAANRLVVEDGENGIIINPRERGEIRDAIIDLATSEELRTRLGCCAVKTASKYDEERVFPLIEGYYREIMEISRKGRVL